MPIQRTKDAIKRKHDEKGTRWFVVRAVVIVAALWLIWPDSDVIESPNSLPAQTPEPTVKEIALKGAAKGWEQIELTDKNLREVMTLKQATYYNDSFQWMMEYGESGESRPFDGKNMAVIIAAGEPFTNENNVQCRGYSEKLILAGRANGQRGIACQRSANDWCRQPQGQKATCPDKEVTGIAGLKLEKDITMRKWSYEMDQQLNQLPSF